MQLLGAPKLRPLWVALQVLPIPGLGAIVVGTHNPHTRLRRNGTAQLLLVLLGSWPLVLPGLAGLAWAIRDAIYIAQADTIPPPEE